MNEPERHQTRNIMFEDFEFIDDENEHHRAFFIESDNVNMRQAHILEYFNPEKHILENGKTSNQS